MLRKTYDLRKRSKTAIEILKMCRVIGRAGNRLLVDTIRRPPESAIVAKINKTVAADVASVAIACWAGAT